MQSMQTSAIFPFCTGIVNKNKHLSKSCYVSAELNHHEGQSQCKVPFCTGIVNKNKHLHKINFEFCQKMPMQSMQTSAENGFCTGNILKSLKMSVQKIDSALTRFCTGNILKSLKMSVQNPIPP
jgi:hypothetical protein